MVDSNNNLSAEELYKLQVDKIRNYVINTDSWIEVSEIAKDFGVDRHQYIVPGVKNTTIAQLISNKLLKRGVQTCRINYRNIKNCHHSYA
jgi:histone acetyltransferase (RNA polymerase elongator complex component)